MKEKLRWWGGPFADALKRAWENCGRFEKLLAGAAAGFCAVCISGLLVAYGGTVLMIWLALLVQAGLVWLIAKTEKIAFPQQEKEKSLYRAFAAAAVVGLILFAALIYWRKIVYYYDYINYYKKQITMAATFSNNGFYAMRVLAESLLMGDYKMFMNMFIAVPFVFTTRTVNAFMMSYFFTCILPIYYVWLLVAKKLGKLCGVCHWKLYYGVCGLLLAAWPFLMHPLTHGMPDAFGLVFVGLILLVTVEYRFETVEPLRLICIFIATFCLILTRRWYMYFVVAYYCCYALMTLILAGKAFRRVFKNIAVFGICSAAGILAPLCLTFKNIFSYDYADRYGAFYGGGFWENVHSQIGYLGWAFLLLIAAGVVYCLVKKELRAMALVMCGAWLGGMLLFTRIQSFGYHQSLILIPTYLFFLFGSFALAGAMHKKAMARLCSGACGVVLAANFAAALPAGGTATMGGLMGNVALDTTRRTDLAQIDQMVDWILENCAPGETAYINAGGEYAAQVFSASREPDDLEGTIVWELSVPSTHGLPTPICDAKLFFVPDKPGMTELIQRVNEAMKEENPLSQHYRKIKEFPFPTGVTFTAYERTQPADEEELAFLLSLFEDYNERWPDLFSQTAQGYAMEHGIPWQ